MTLEPFTLDPELFAIRRFDVAENGVGITFSPNLIDEHGNLRDDMVCVLKLDDYHAYNSRSTRNPPKVIDNLVIVRCCDGSAKLHLIELRKANGRRPTRRLKAEDIEEKFYTAIHDFIEKRYADLFPGDKIADIKAYLVSDPWNHSCREGRREFFEKKVKSSALDAYGARKPFKVFGKSVFINPILPPDPVIEPC